MSNSVIKKSIFTLIWAFLLFSQTSVAKDLTRSKVIQLSDHLNAYRGAQIGMWVDSSSHQNWGEVLGKNFVYEDKKVPNHDPIYSPVWFKMEFFLDSSEVGHIHYLEIENPLIEDLVFYQIRENKLVSIDSNGTNIVIQNRRIHSHNLILELNTSQAGPLIVLFKVKTDKQIQLPVRVQDDVSLVRNVRNRNIIFGIYAGIIFAMFLYNLFLYFTVRDRIYLYYVIYILTVGMVQASIDGFAFSFIWPNSSYLANYAFYFFTILVNITGLAFARKFLHTPQFSKWLNRIHWFLIWVYVSIFLFTLLGYTQLVYMVLQVMAGPVSVYMLVAAIYILKKGFRPAKYFLISWSVLIVGIFVYVLKEKGLIEFNGFTSRSIQIGAAAEVLLLSFALADRINTLKKEKEANHLEALRLAKENEKIIREQNIELERQVDERTQEIQVKNKELKQAINDLKSAQTQLVNAEKMASLGQLTAGIAHEINNPINFVSSNIKPLKRDIEDLYSIIDRFSQLDPQDPNFQSKLQMAKDWMREVDYAYLKEELETLTMGMHEGAYRTVEIVKGLKNFSRIDEADQKLANLNEGIESTLILINSSFRNQIRLEKELGFIPDIECFPGKMNQVFMNLFHNAIYAAIQNIPNTGEGIITVKSFLDEQEIVIQISDNGIGIPEEVLDKIFDPFFTTKPVGEGTGLGLSIVYSIVQSHNGKIFVNSRKGIGTVFEIRVPVKK